MEDHTLSGISTHLKICPPFINVYTYIFIFHSLMENIIFIFSILISSALQPCNMVIDISLNID